MTNEIATITDSNKDLIRRNYCPSATPDEFEMFRAICNRYGLDPFCREAWFVKYGGSQAQIFVGRDGMLAIANRSGQFDGIETTPNFDEKGNLVSATCTVWRKDMSHPFSKTVYLKEYTTGKSLWQTKPITMLQKVAEAQALRAAFTISGLYCEEEMGDAPTPAPVKVERQLTDISVKPEPVKQSSQPDEIKTTAVYTADMVSTSIMPNYQSHGYDMSVFGKALLSNGMYDKVMIDDDYKLQMNNEKTSAPAPKQTKPTLELCDEEVVKEIADANAAERKRTIDQPFCVDCGNTRVLPDEEKESRARFGVALCPKCLSKRMAEELKLKEEQKKALGNLVEASEKASKQTKQSADGVCSVCGKKMTKGELSKWEMFNHGKAPMCSDCASKAE